MNCAECKERLVAWVEGLLDDPERQSVGHHLEACAACRDELDAITTLHGRLIDEGRSYRNREAADAVMARILREQQFKLRRVEPAPGRLAVRRFVMNRFGKLAVAAVFLAAVGLGAILFQGTANITLAEVAERLEKIESFVYRGRVTIAGVPGMAAGQKMETETRTVFSAQYGMRMDASVDGQVVSTTYVDPAAGVMISVMPTQKRYTKFTLTPQMLEDARRKNSDPRRIVQEFLKAGYTDLGSRTVNGVEQRGFECRQVGLSAGMGDNAVGEIWVDTRTGLVVEMTIRGRLADGQIEVVCNDFEWNVPCKAEDFAVEIPADYQQMGDFNVAEADSGEQLVEGLRFWAVLSGGKYPKSLATTSLAQEMREIAHPEAGAAALPEGDATQYMLELQAKLLKLRVGAAHFTMLEATGKDAAYYGQTVKPGQADKVLARWKDDGGTYTVIFGDLRIETKVSPQRLALSERVRQGRLHAFVEIDAGVIHPTRGTSDTDVRYYAKNPIMDDIRRWIGGPINEALRHQRLADAGIAASAVPDLFVWVNVRPEGLVTAHVRTGEIQESTGASEVRAIAVPVAAVMLMFLLIMMGASPLITSVMEEKTQRIAEVLLGSVRPFQFMAGKLLGGVAVALTGSAVYLGAGIAVAVRLAWTAYVPYDLLPWFFTYLVVAIVMIGAVYAALGSACSEARDAQSLSFPVLLPVLIPMFMLGPILKSPDGPLATALSFFPPCMPTMMLMRQSMPGGVPVWQPWAALGVSLAFTVLMVWAGGRIFRVAILMQGTPPRWSNLIRWAIRG